MLPTVKYWGLAFVIQRSQWIVAKRDRENTLKELLDFMNSDSENKLSIIGSVRLYGYFYGYERKAGKTYGKDGDFSHSADIRTIEKDGDNYIVSTDSARFIIGKNDYNRDVEKMLSDLKKGKLSDMHAAYLTDYKNGNETKLYL